MTWLLALSCVRPPPPTGPMLGEVVPLAQSYEVVPPDGLRLDPSGLARWKGQWVTVSDKVDAVFALVPDCLKHAVDGFQFYRDPSRKLDPCLRELGQTRAGYSRGSQFVYSQHCKACRSVGLSEDKIEAIPHWQLSNAFSELETSLDQGVVIQQRIVDLKEAAAEAGNAFKIAQLRYEEGEEELLNVLTIQQRVIGANSSLSSVQRLLLEQRVNLNLALGGSWTD